MMINIAEFPVCFKALYKISQVEEKHKSKNASNRKEEWKECLGVGRGQDLNIYQGYYPHIDKLAISEVRTVPSSLSINILHRKEA